MGELGDEVLLLSEEEEYLLRQNTSLTELPPLCRLVRFCAKDAENRQILVDFDMQCRRRLRKKLRRKL